MGTRLGEGRIRRARSGGKGTPATTLLFTPNRPNPSFPSLRSWRFFYSFSLVVGKVRDTVAQKPKTRSNQKTVEEGSWGEGSEIFLRCFFLSSSPPLPSFFRQTSRGRVNTNPKRKSHQKFRQLRRLPFSFFARARILPTPKQLPFGYFQQLYHRGAVIEKNAPSRPLACALLGMSKQNNGFKHPVSRAFLSLLLIFSFLKEKTKGGFSGRVVLQQVSM